MHVFDLHDGFLSGPGLPPKQPPRGGAVPSGGTPPKLPSKLPPGSGATQPGPASASPASGPAGSVDQYLPRLALRAGMCGPAVRLWQEWLAPLSRLTGTPTPAVTGEFDAETRGATMAAQQALRIRVDGIVGPETRQSAYMLLAARGKGGTLPRSPYAVASPCSSPFGGTGGGAAATPDATGAETMTDAAGGGLPGGISPTLLMAGGAALLLMMSMSGKK